MPEQSTTDAPADRLRLLWALVIALVCVAIIVATLIYVGYAENLMDFGLAVVGLVFSPHSIILVLALGVEYIILKSADRTRLLRLEVAKLHEKRRAEVTKLRLTREGLEALRDKASSSGATELADEADQLVDYLRPPEARRLSEESSEE